MEAFPVFGICGGHWSKPEHPLAQRSQPYSAVVITDPHNNKVQFVSNAFVEDPSGQQIREVLSADVFFVIEEGGEN